MPRRPPVPRPPRSPGSRPHEHIDPRRVRPEGAPPSRIPAPTAAQAASVTAQLRHRHRHVRPARRRRHLVEQPGRRPAPPGRGVVAHRPRRRGRLVAVRRLRHRPASRVRAPPALLPDPRARGRRGRHHRGDPREHRVDGPVDAIPDPSRPHHAERSGSRRAQLIRDDLRGGVLRSDRRHLRRLEPQRRRTEEGRPELSVAHHRRNHHPRRGRHPARQAPEAAPERGRVGQDHGRLPAQCHHRATTQRDHGARRARDGDRAGALHELRPALHRSPSARRRHPRHRPDRGRCLQRRAHPRGPRRPRGHPGHGALVSRRQP